MTEKLHILLTGGTIAMGTNAAGHYVNCYDMRHLMLAVALRDEAEKNKERKSTYEDAMQQLKTLKLGGGDVDAALDKILTLCGYDSFEDVYDYYGIARDSAGCGITKPYDALEKNPHTGVNTDSLIDSIAFDMRLHFPVLAESAREKLEQNTGPVVVIGGTDSLEFYAPALSYQMAAEGNLQKQSLHFLSAMKSFEEDPWHVADLLKGTLQAAHAQAQQKSGAFLLCPEMHEGRVKAMHGHEVRSGVVKISAKLPSAFRSHAGLAFTVPLNGEARFYKHAAVPTPQAGEPTHTLAPVLKDTAPEAVLAYLQALHAAENIPAGTIQPIELSLALVRSPQAPAIANMIGALREQNIHTLLIHPSEALHEQALRLGSKGQKPWRMRDNGFMTTAFSNGAIRRTRPTADLWVQARLGQLAIPEHTPCGIATVTPAPKPIEQCFIGLRYVPDSEAFAQSLQLAAAAGNQIVIEALPGGALPGRIQASVEALLQQGKTILLGFKYAGRTYGKGDQKFTESAGNGYGQSAWVQTLAAQYPDRFTLLGETSPADVLQPGSVRCV